MKLALFGLVTAALLALGSGCANCCGPIGARPGSGCDIAFAEALWKDSCDTKCNGCTGPRCSSDDGCGSALDRLFGGGVCTTGCTTSYHDSGSGGGGPVGCGPVGCGPAGCGPVNSGFLGGGTQGGGYADGLGCNDPNCPGGCLGAGAAMGRAGQPVLRGMSRVAAIPHNMQNRCANGGCGRAMGPTQGNVQYPYYTTRGPRDFFLANPPGIGP